MTRESRVIFLTTAMLFAYAAWALFENGGFIFPIPLNETIFVVVALIFFFINLDKKLMGIYAVITGILWLLTTQFFWSFIFGHQTMEFYQESLVTDYCYLGFSILLLIAGIYSGIQQKKWLGYIFLALFVVSLIGSVALNNSLLLLAAFGFMAISTQIYKAAAPFHLLWLLLFILKSTEWLSYILN